MRRAANLAFVLAFMSPGTASAGEPLYAGLPPAEALKTIHVAPGFKVELVAHEPLVADPVSIAWDAHGRMWIAEMPDYPTGPPAGRVRWLEDTDGDGLPDRGVVFAEGLPCPTSVLPYRGGVLVSAAPDILYLEDTDGDGRADLRRVVLTGFGLGTTQLRVNGLQRGIDGRIYGANGRSGGSIRRPEDPVERAVSIEQRDFRFDPDTFVPETIAGPSQFGFAFDAWGHRFLSWNTVHIREEILSPHDLERHPQLTRTATVASISDHGDSARVFPLAPPPRTFNNEPTDHFNASCGLTIECGGIFPSSHAGNAFVCEPLTGLIHRDILEPGPGPALVAKRGEDGVEFLASTDPWFHPVNCRSGPDGALYIVDFYREMVEHPEYVHDDKVREKTNFSLGKGHGRIYRIVPDGASLLRVEDISKLSTTELVARIANPNGRVRELAQQLLLERRDRMAMYPLNALARESDPLGKTWAIWTLHALAGLEPRKLELALESTSARARESALRVAREQPMDLATVRSSLPALVMDDDPGVRLQAALALGDVRESTFEKTATMMLVVAVVDAADAWIPEAIVSSLRGREALFLQGLLGFDSPHDVPNGWRERLRAPIREAAFLVGASGDPRSEGEVLALVDWVLHPKYRERYLTLADGLASGLERAGKLARGEEWNKAFAWARQLALDSREDLYVQSTAASVLGRAPWSLAGETLRRLLDPRADLSLQVAAAKAISSQDVPEAATTLLDAWPAATPSLRGALLDGLSRRPQRLAKLADALESGAVSPRDIDPARRDALLRAASAPDRKRLEAVLAKGGKIAGDRATVVERYRSSAPASSSAANGAAVFAARCATCHRFAGLGYAVGPDLSGVGKKSRDELLVAILDPNRSTVPGYTAYSVALEDGQVLTGILAGETAQAVTLRRADGVEDGISRTSIRSITSTGLSLMPEGLEAMLSPADVADLLEYLRVGEAKKN